MKKFFTILFSSFCVAFASNAQSLSVNTDGTTADPSAILDVKSTTKGFLMPRATSAQRIGIVSPALGLLVFDTDTKTIWTYNGNAWTNLTSAGGGGSFSLPFSQTINTVTSALQITNQGAGAAIEVISSTQFGTGMTAKATGDYGWGLYAVSTGVGSQSIRSYADNGIAFHGENNNPANTNTLMNLWNKGAGKTGSFQLTNTSSTSPNVQIVGNHLGGQLKIYQTNTANAFTAVSIENSGTGTGVEATSTTGDGVIGISNTGYGIKGVTNTGLGKAGVHGQNNGTAGSGVVGVSNASNTQGVYGASANGIAVRALGDNYRAVQATSYAGTALHGTSTSGYALETYGKVKISGGNTNPSNGAVLTSDASGNAKWENNRIAFRASGIGSNYMVVEPGYNKVQFNSVNYDLGDNFTGLNGGVASPLSSTFVVPVKGVYHFDAAIRLVGNDVLDIPLIIINLKVIRDGQTFWLASSQRPIWSVNNTQASISTDLYLFPGDVIFVEVGQVDLAISNVLFNDSALQNYFSGHLVYRD